MKENTKELKIILKELFDIMFYKKVNIYGEILKELRKIERYEDNFYGKSGTKI